MSKGTIMFRQIYLLCLTVVVASLGCSTYRTTGTARTGLEQLLISNAIDQSLDKIDFSSLHGTGVYVEEKYLDGVDKNYVIAAVRHRILNGGARLVSKLEDSDITMEIRSGGIGTDIKETFFGIPEIAVPLPFPVQLPEFRLFNTTAQYGTAKIGLIAYETKSRQALGAGGISLARSNDNNMYLLGIGPFNHGSIRDELTQGTHVSGFSAASGKEFTAWLKRNNSAKHADFEKPSSTQDELLP